MRREKWLQIVIVLAAMCVLSACGKKPDNETVTPTTAPTLTAAEVPLATPTATPVAEPTEEPKVTPAEPTVTATPTVNAEPTATPTATPTPGLAEMAARSKELHEAVMPKLTANPLGTAPELTEQDILDYTFGFSRRNGVTATCINLLTGTEANYDDQYTYVIISGLKNEEVQRKINNRIKTVVETMKDPGYLPNVTGVMAILKERGLPVSAVSCWDSNNESGIFSVYVTGTWSWYEDRIFADDDELSDFLQTVGWGDDGSFSVGNRDYEWIDESRLKTQIVYTISERIDLNFDLRTGEELTLSDLFPEGFDYLTFLNEEIEKEAKYEYWFDADTYEQSGTIRESRGGDQYDSNKEYDGGLIREPFTGDEMFLMSSGAIMLVTNRGEYVYISAPFMIANRDRGEDLYLEKGNVRAGSLGSVDICEEDTYGPIDAVKIGSVPVSQSGRDEIRAEVYRGKDELRCWSLYDMDISPIIDEYFSNEKILELAQESLSVIGDISYAGKEPGLYLMDAKIFPNGYVYLRWIIQFKVLNEDVEDGYYYRCNYEGVWFKDGKGITQEELFDCSFEELLAELLGGLRSDDQTLVVGKQKAKEIASALMPYFVGMDDPTRNIDYWSWQDFLFRWTENGEVHSGGPYQSADPEEYGEKIPEELRAVMPELLLSTLEGGWRTLYTEDRYLVWKHLQMYEGYPFP